MYTTDYRRLCGSLLVLGCVALFPVLAWGQATTTSQVQRDDQRVQELVDRLTRIADEAERGRSAKPGVIRSLRDLAGTYDRPWRVSMLRDDFRDGDYTRGTVWQVDQGEFWVDSQGLRSRAKAEPAAAAGTQQSGKEDPAAAVLGMVLERMVKREGSGQQQAAAPPTKVSRTEIFVPVGITNAFAMRMEVTVLDGSAPFLFGPYQGSDRNTGYRLVYSPSPQNARGTLELLRLSARGSTVADQASGPVNLEGAAPHVIEWTRTRQGEMAVTIDGKDVMRTTDLSVRDAFGGLVIVNLGGDYAVREIAVNGTP